MTIILTCVFGAGIGFLTAQYVNALYKIATQLEIIADVMEHSDESN